VSRPRARPGCRSSRGRVGGVCRRSFSHTWGEASSETQKFAMAASIGGAAGMQVVCEGILKEGHIDVPYTVRWSLLTRTGCVPKSSKRHLSRSRRVRFPGRRQTRRAGGAGASNPGRQRLASDHRSGFQGTPKREVRGRRVGSSLRLRPVRCGECGHE